MRFLPILLLVAACHGKAGDGPPCSTVAARFFTIARTDLASASLDPEMRRGVEAQLPAMRDSLAQLCGDDAWPATVRDCMVRAGDHVALAACELRLTDAQRAALDRAASGQEPQKSSGPATIAP